MQQSTENLILQLEGDSPEDLPKCELLSLDKQLRTIRDLLKVETARTFSYSNALSEKKVSSRNPRQSRI